MGLEYHTLSWAGRPTETGRAIPASGTASLKYKYTRDKYSHVCLSHPKSWNRIYPETITTIRPIERTRKQTRSFSWRTQYAHHSGTKVFAAWGTTLVSPASVAGAALLLAELGFCLLCISGSLMRSLLVMTGHRLGCG